MARVLVLGLGNPLRGDDGIGPRVVTELHRRGLPEGVTALDFGTGGLDLLNVWQGWPRVIVVDAADVGRLHGEETVPGQIVRFTPDEVRFLVAPDGFSLHDAGLAEALALGEALGQDLPELVILSVQPARIGWGEGLSPPVEAALPALLDAVMKEIRRIVADV